MVLYYCIIFCFIIFTESMGQWCGNQFYEPEGGKEQCDCGYKEDCGDDPMCCNCCNGQISSNDDPNACTLKQGMPACLRIFFMSPWQNNRQESWRNWLTEYLTQRFPGCVIWSLSACTHVHRRDNSFFTETSEGVEGLHTTTEYAYTHELKTAA